MAAALLSEALGLFAGEPLAVVAKAQTVWDRLRGRRQAAERAPDFIERLRSRKAQVGESLLWEAHLGGFEIRIAACIGFAAKLDLQDDRALALLLGIVVVQSEQMFEVHSFSLRSMICFGQRVYALA